ncbi:MAG: hypothetical protein AAFP76_15575, partial [Bacteroidota bacterium]
DNHFEDTFGHLGKIISENVSFSNCKFQGYVTFLGNILPDQNQLFEELVFANNVSFKNCNFEDEFRLSSTKFLKRLNISECEFYGECLALSLVVVGDFNLSNCNFQGRVLFHGNTYRSKCYFSSNEFNNTAQFSLSHHHDIFNLHSTVFNNFVEFHSNIYHEWSTFVGIDFREETRFLDETFKNASFQRTKFSQKNNLFQGIKVPDGSNLSFVNIIFYSGTSFRNCDCFNIQFTDSDITDIKFSSCNWNLSDRLITKDELSDLKTIKNRARILEPLYRQLKKNFDGQKNWELSGLAYISEMEMRKKRLSLENDYFYWFIYWFYGYFGGYTQNIGKPLYRLFWLTTICTFAYFFIDLDIANAIERSIKASIPYIEIRQENPYPNYWLLFRNFQFILSSIFLAFFILALRKRFKQ